MELREDFIKIKRKGNTTEIHCGVNSFYKKDDESDMFVLIIPSIDLSAYGDTLEEANDMMKETLQTYIENLSKLSMKKIESELLKLGWSAEQFKTKVFHPNFDVFEKLEKEGVKDFQPSKFESFAA